MNIINMNTMQILSLPWKVIIMFFYYNNNVFLWSFYGAIKMEVVDLPFGGTLVHRCDPQTKLNRGKRLFIAS